MLIMAVAGHSERYSYFMRVDVEIFLTFRGVGCGVDLGRFQGKKRIMYVERFDK